MPSTALFRAFRALTFALLVLAAPAHAQTKFPLVLETKTVDASTVMTMIITSDGAIDLSKITNADIAHAQVVFVDPFLEPGQHTETGMGAKKIDATSRKLTVTAAVERPGRVERPEPRQMRLLFGDVTVSFDFTLLPQFVCPASCQLPNKCINKRCVLPPTA